LATISSSAQEVDARRIRIPTADSPQRQRDMVDLLKGAIRFDALINYVRAKEKSTEKFDFPSVFTIGYQRPNSFIEL
jgi:hypothetical protein